MWSWRRFCLLRWWSRGWCSTRATSRLLRKLSASRYLGDGWVVVSDSPAPIRSYQRIFKPDRRLYQIDGRRLPIPGGLSLEWLGWAFAALVAVLVLSQRSLVLALVAAGIGGVLGASSRGWSGAAILGPLAFGG